MQHNYISPSAMLRYFHQYQSSQCHKYPTISNSSISTDVGKIAGLANVAYRLNSLKNSKPDNIDSSKLSVTQAMYNVSIRQFNVSHCIVNVHICQPYDYINLSLFQYIVKIYIMFLKYIFFINPPIDPLKTRIRGMTSVSAQVYLLFRNQTFYKV